MLKTILSAILNDADFFKLPVLKAKNTTSQLPDDLRPFYTLVRDFFLRLCGKAHTEVGEIDDDDWQKARDFLRLGAALIPAEWDTHCRQNQRFQSEQAALAEFLTGASQKADVFEKIRRIQQVFFPQASELWDENQRARLEKELRLRRTVRIKRKNPRPIDDPAKDILFTSNILVTLPLKGREDRLSPALKKRVRQIRPDEQKYWYDHPIPLGIDPQKNEALYGMRGLDEMMRLEKEQGNAAPQAKITCLLSASTTHDGLHSIVKEYFEKEFADNGPWENLTVFLFSETDCRLLVKEVLQPLAEIFFPDQDSRILDDIFGVDGEYGRHYSFLKAIAAFWQVFVDPQIKATFKIDLDQVFDQQALLRDTGQTALEHFKTDLWGAEAEDSDGRPVRLGMIAGALVNHDDIDQSLFTPDVTYPPGRLPRPDELIFFSRLPQALSTAAEMMCRYGSAGPDGKRTALQRVHVTGGTNGILLDALRDYRPFTPADIGRAEDQAYLLSVLFAKKPYLRYVHKPGLIMRHDKEAFAQEAIRAAELGKIIGDYVRILQFTFYARALPWPLEETKALVDPFTGSFITALPFTIVYLRFTFKFMALIEQGEFDKALEFMKLGSRRLLPWMQRLSKEENPLKESFRSQRTAWDLYYDILDRAEEALKRREERIIQIKQRAREIVEACRFNI